MIGFAAPPITVRAMNLREINYERARVGRRALTEVELAEIEPLQLALTWMPEPPAPVVQPEPEQAPPVVEPKPMSWERIQGLMAATAASRTVSEPKGPQRGAESGAVASWDEIT